MKKVFFFLLFLGFSGVAFSDVIYLKTGETVSGTIVEQSEDSVKVDPGTGSLLTYRNDAVSKIEVIPQREAGVFDPCTMRGIESACEANKSLYEEFKKTKDAALCKKLEGTPEARAMCSDSVKLFFAVTDKDAASCGAIHNENFKQSCSTLVDRALHDPNFSFTIPPFERLPFLWGMQTQQ